MVPARKKRAFALMLALALLLLLALSGCGHSAQLKEGQKLMKQYLSGLGRGAALLDSHVDVLRPAADTLVASDYVKGSFRANGQTWDFAVDTATGEIYTSERLSEFSDCCVRQITARLGLDRSEYVADCLTELWRPAWQEENIEWPWEEAYLGEVVPVGVTDMEAYAARALEDEDVRILLFLACRDGELREERWSGETLSDWDAVEVQLFGFSDAEPLPTLETFPRDYHYVNDRVRVTVMPGEVRYRPAESEGS